MNKLLFSKEDVRASAPRLFKKAVLKVIVDFLNYVDWSLNQQASLTQPLKKGYYGKGRTIFETSAQLSNYFGVGKY
jgi:hypothetical protein